MDENDHSGPLHTVFPSFDWNEDDADDVDISVDDIRLPSTQDAIQASIDKALIAWDRINPVAAVEMLKLIEQRASTQEFARIALKDGNLTPQEQHIQQIFRSLLTEEECIAARLPCPEVQQFLEKYPRTRKGTVENPPFPGWMFANRSAANATAEAADDIPEDSLYLIEVMHPSHAVKKNQLMLLRGSQPLTEFVDAIYCRDQQYLKEYGLRSKMLYMGGTVMIDQRDDDYLDYSQEVRRWLMKHPSLHETYPGFDKPSLSMECTTLNDLHLKLHEAYLYVHIGNCEHWVYVRNIRLLHDMDERRVEQYPIRLSKNIQHQKCLACQVHAAKYITFDDPMALDDPMFFCDSCYYVAHYDANGKLMESLSNFKVFPYYPDD
ncbi:hypothetical protein AeMF1_004400 [Aphanomyces euteiches]|nr:hypothetical protein AeMF1_004400 [Aphanomyces euteiches]